MVRPALVASRRRWHRCDASAKLPKQRAVGCLPDTDPLSYIYEDTHRRQAHERPCASYEKFGSCAKTARHRAKDGLSRLPTQRGAGDVPSMVPGAENVINLISDEEPDDDALTVPAAQAAPAARLPIVPLSQQRPPRTTSKPGHFMHQPAANGTAGRMPAKQAKRKQAAARAAGSKSAASSSSTAAGPRGAASSSSAVSSSSGHRGEVDVHEIVKKRIDVWWDGDEKWCAARQGSTHATEMPP